MGQWDIHLPSFVQEKDTSPHRSGRVCARRELRMDLLSIKDRRNAHWHRTRKIPLNDKLNTPPGHKTTTQPCSVTCRLVYNYCSFWGTCMCGCVIGSSPVCRANWNKQQLSVYGMCMVEGFYDPSRTQHRGCSCCYCYCTLKTERAHKQVHATQFSTSSLPRHLCMFPKPSPCLSYHTSLALVVSHNVNSVY